MVWLAPRGFTTTRWPLHWRVLSGIPPEFARNPQREFEATVAGRVTSLSASGPTWHARVADGTGSLVVTCPAATTTLGPVMGIEFEFDVLVLGGKATATAIRPLDAP